MENGWKKGIRIDKETVRRERVEPRTGQSVLRCGDRRLRSGRCVNEAQSRTETKCL